MTTKKRTIDSSIGQDETSPDASVDHEAVIMLIAMRRDKPAHEDGPVTADVHQDEVDNMLAGGWEISPSLNLPVDNND